MAPVWIFMVLLVALSSVECKNTTEEEITCSARHTLKDGECPDVTSKYVRCLNACNGKEITAKDECDQAPECCFVADTCVFRRKVTRFNKHAAKKREERLFEELEQKFNISAPQRHSDGARSLQMFPGFPMPPGLLDDSAPMFGGIGLPASPPACQPFPFNCPSVSLQQIITPPIDIPYCLREYCSQNDQALENDMEKCLMHPGCYFDRELHILRQSFGHQVLPRVPVCHLAIRNHKFLQTTEKATRQLGKWNPALTQCILTQYAEEIYDSPKGCDMNDVIEHFGYLPKMAGWNGIQEKECFLINGCWSQSRGCFYPMKMSELFIKSGQSIAASKDMLRSTRQRYGMPKCQNFDASTPKKFLKSYHNCLSSGCALDPAVSDKMYYYNLWNLTNSLPPQLQYLSWVDIANSKMRADNYEATLNSYRRMSVTDQSALLVNSLGSVSNTRVTNLISSINTANLFNPLTFQLSGISSNLNNGIKLPFGFNAQTSLQPVVKSVGPDLCPYRQVHMYNFPTLKGRFTGCCERNLCYLPKNYQALQRSGMSNYFSNWGQWSVCSKSCDSGKTSRTRVCIGSRFKDCHGVYEESKSCNTYPCPEWTQWGSYIPCSVSCGGGSTFRTRKCTGKGCVGPRRQDVNCNTGRCPQFSNWLQWSPCTVTCGVGTRLRTRKCIHPGFYKCPDKDPIEEKGCRAFCGKIVWSAWSNCDDSTCKRTRVPKCRYENGEGHCQNVPSIQTKWCEKVPCYCRRYPTYGFCQSWNRAR